MQVDRVKGRIIEGRVVEAIRSTAKVHGSHLALLSRLASHDSLLVLAAGKPAPDQRGRQVATRPG